MKRVLLIGVLLLLVLGVLFGCSEPADTSSTPDTTVNDPEDTPRVTTGDSGQVIPGELAEGQDYIAVENTAKWEKDTVDFSRFAHSGAGSDGVNKINLAYNGYQKTYLLVGADGSKKEVKHSDIRKLATVGMVVTAKDDAAKSVTFEAYPVDLRVLPSWTGVTARAGSYLMFEFTTNVEADFAVTVTAKEGGGKETAAYFQDEITVSGKDGTFKGIAKCTVPYVTGETYYINICADTAGYPVVASIPVDVKTAKYSTDYTLIFQGDWELIKDEEYLPNLIDLFYNVYPRLYARWGVGTEPKQITFRADKDYDGVAYCAGTEVCVAVDYANGNPRDIGFFSHEITHSIQQYDKLNYGEGSTYNGVTYDAWWTENMASYGGFRYFHWGYSTKFVQFYDATEFVNWGETYAGYGDGCQVFLSYLDWKFPTYDKNGDGKVTPDEYGVIDMINYTIKTTEVKIYDNPVDPNTPFNKAVYKATGEKYDSLDAIRTVYKEDINSGAFRCNGFGDYKDNFITENLKGVPNPVYPKWEEVVPGDKTATALAEPMLTGNNLLVGATVKEFSSDVASNPASAIIDGVLTNKGMWQSQTADNADDYKYKLQGFDHGFVIDMGEVKRFDTYTLVNRGYENTTKHQNTNEWEILVSEDGINWTSVDYQKYVDGEGNRISSPDAVSFNIGEVSARYIEMRIYTTDKANVGRARIVEFMVFDT